MPKLKMGGPKSQINIHESADGLIHWEAENNIVRKTRKERGTQGNK